MEPNTEHRIRALGSSLRRQRDAILARSAVVASAGLSAATRPVGSATFDNVTCKEWVVVDQDGKPRIGSRTHADGTAGVQWIDKDEKTQIDAATSPDGAAKRKGDMAKTTKKTALAGSHSDRDVRAER
ncbi:MAG: hypothetical protein LW636_09675 [Planctomycetaceae bacterium]|nr:hypothetical protein [Planctomycetaceae bacterium]